MMSKNRLHKQGSGFGHWSFTVILIIVLLWWFIGFATRDCRKNTDCQRDSYCDYRYTCQKIPVIDGGNAKDILKQNSFFYLLIGGIIGGALTYYVMRKEVESKGKEKSAEHKEVVQK